MALAKAMYLAFTYNTTRYIARPGLVNCVHHTTLLTKLHSSQSTTRLAEQCCLLAVALKLEEDW